MICIIISLVEIVSGEPCGKPAVYRRCCLYCHTLIKRLQYNKDCAADFRAEITILTLKQCYNTALPVEIGPRVAERFAREGEFIGFHVIGASPVRDDIVRLVADGDIRIT